jgi:DNA-binding MarR family transcriptional regulator
VKIEEAIKQTKPFGSVYQKTGVNLMYTHSWYAGRMKSFFKQFGLTSKQYNILRILKGAGKPVSTSFIRERLLDKMSDVSRIVDRMHDKGLLTKDICIDDKRLIDVGLTPRALQLLDEVKLKSKQMDEILSRLTPEEADRLNGLLDKLRGN